MTSPVELPQDVEWEAVESSNIARLAHDRKMMQLWVEFKNGGVYRYDGVPRSLYLELLLADSVGSLFAHTVRADKTRYPFKKVS